MKKFITLLMSFFTISNLAAQENSKWDNYIEAVKFPVYLDLFAGASVTSFSNFDGLFGNQSISLGVPINRNWAVCVDFMQGSSGSAHFIKSFSGFGLQGRYSHKRILANLSFGKVQNARIGGDLINQYRFIDNNKFYGRLGFAYRFWKVCSVGVAAYTSTNLEYDVYDYDEITSKYDIYSGKTDYNIGGIAIAFGVHLFPPYTVKNKNKKYAKHTKINL
jgi:hypothetical protein